MKISTIETLLLQALCGVVATLTVSLIGWGTWATIAIKDLQADLRLLKVANHLAVEEPPLAVHYSSWLALPGWVELPTERKSNASQEDSK